MLNEIAVLPALLAPSAPGATKLDSPPSIRLRSQRLVSAMACPDFRKLQQETEANRRQLGEFHVKKLPHWQRDGEAVCMVRSKQQAILRAQELMDWHSTSCQECMRSAQREES